MANFTSEAIGHQEFVAQCNLPLIQWYQNLAALLQVITQEKGLSHCNLQSHFHKTSTAGESHRQCEIDHSSSDTVRISQA